MTEAKQQRVQDEMLANLLTEIETVRIQRQQHYAHQSHPTLKRFTQQELNDEVCPTYKNLLVGRSHRMPDRKTILQITKYLECTTIESNELLTIAGYVPIHQKLAGEALQLVLEQANSFMNGLSLPGMIVTEDLQIKAANSAFEQLFEVPAELFLNQNVSMPDLHFSLDFPVRARSTFDEVSFRHWESHALNGIHVFKTTNAHFRNEEWYKRAVQHFNKYNSFSEYWIKSQEQHLEPEEDNIKMILAKDNTGELIPIRYKRIGISLGHYMFPRVEAYLPVDEPAHLLFQRLGCFS